MGFLIYFYLLKFNFSIKFIESTLIGFSIIYLILFGIQLNAGNIPLFGYWKELKQSRGVIRFIFPCEGLLFFSISYYISKIGKKSKIHDLFFLLLFLLVIYYQATRIYYLAVFIVILVHILFNVKTIHKVIIFSTLFIVYNLFTFSELQVIKGIREATKSDLSYKSDYIRIKSANYFLSDFSPFPMTSILGNGAPYYKSILGKKLMSLMEHDGYYIEDLGLLGAYTYFGILMIIGYLLMFFRSYKALIPDKYKYLKYYMLILAIMMFTTRAPINGSFTVFSSIVVYLLQKIDSQKKPYSKKSD
jgi:hypothetical protein